MTTSSPITNPSRKCEILESKVRIHRTREVLKNLSGVFTFPVADVRTERGLRDQNFDVPEAVPDPNDNSDTEDVPKADNADELSAKAEVLPGTDERGLTFPGRDDALGEQLRSR